MDASVQSEPPSSSPAAGLCSQCGFMTQLKALADAASPLTPPSVDSLLDKCISTNDPLLESTTEELSSHMDSGRSFLRNLEESLSQLEQLVSGLKYVRDEVAIRVERCQAVLQTVTLRTLPYDCLSLIFSHCVQDPVGYDDSLFDCTGAIPPFLREATNPWSLSQVCSRWRETALAYPQMWSTIILNIKAMQDAEERMTSMGFSRIKLHVARSATHPLNVVIWSPDHALGFSRGMRSEKYVKNFLVAIFFHSEKWKRFYLCSLPGSLSYFDLIGNVFPLPQLQHLSVETPLSRHLSENSEQSTSLGNFACAPLRSLCILPNVFGAVKGGGPGNGGYASSLLNLGRGITAYRTPFICSSTLPEQPYPLDMISHLNALRCLPNLRRWTAMCLFMADVPPKWSAIPPGDKIPLSMKSLEFINLKEDPYNPGAIAQIFSHLTTPALREFGLEGHLNEACITTLVQFIERSECKLQKLTLIDTEWTIFKGMNLLPLLKKAPSVTELGLRYSSNPNWTSDSDQLDLLSTPNVVLPPNLEVLTLCDETGVLQVLLDGVKEARPSLDIRHVRQLRLDSC
jgi:hypothetical protein